MQPLTIAALVLAALSLPPSIARAQGIANSLHELRLLVRPGETVTVVDGAGHEVRGRIESLSATQIVLGTREGQRSWGDADLRSIRQRRGDPLGNGALIGLAAGAAVGTAGGLALLESGDSGALVLWVAAVYGGLGAAIGVGIDALVTREYVIYQPTGQSTARLRVSPVLTPRAQGVHVTLTF